MLSLDGSFAVEVPCVVMLLIFITLLGVAVLLPGVALAFALRRWFVPAWLATREETRAGGEATHFRTRLALSSLD